MKISIEERKLKKEELIEKVDSGQLDISNALKMIRVIYNMNQEEYAKKVGLTRKTIYQIENDPDKSSMQSINKALNPMKLKLKVSRS